MREPQQLNAVVAVKIENASVCDSPQHRSFAMIDPDLFREFEKWYDADTAGDSEFANQTASQFLAWADSLGHLDEVLVLPSGKMSLREWLGINVKPSNPANPFPDVRRKGGDDDRGFSPALNQEMRSRIPK
jgi:hypothetical protein